MISFTKEKLDNGLEIYVLPVNKTSKVISVDIFYKVGSRNETLGKSGLAHMLEHLSFKSTKNLKAGEFDAIVKGFGGVNNASTGFDFTHYYIKCSSTYLNKCLELFAELMINLELKNEEFQVERQVVLEEQRLRTENNPLGYLYFTLFNHAFVYHPYHWTPIGFSKDIQNWQIQDLKDFYKLYYQPCNAVLVLSGDVDESAILSAKKYFKDIKNTKELPKFHTIEPKQNGAKRIELIKKEYQTSYIAIAYKIPSFTHKDSAALSAITELLSSKSSVVRKVLVDELCLVNDYYVYENSSVDENLFIFVCVCNQNVKADLVEKHWHKIIDKFLTHKIKPKDLIRIKNNIKKDWTFSLNTASSVSNTYGSYLAQGDLSPLLSYVSDIEKLSEDDLLQCFKRYFVKENSTTIILKGQQNE